MGRGGRGGAVGCGVAGVGWGGVGVEVMGGDGLGYDVMMLWVIRETDVYCNRTVYISNIYE